MSKYAKFLVVLVGITVMVLDHYLGPDSFASQIVITVATALGVWSTPNRTNDRW